MGEKMVAPLFDIKSKFSEYVTMAENGEVVEITKHGKTRAVIISVEEYSKLKAEYRPSFMENLRKWKAKTGGLTEAEFEDFAGVTQRDKSVGVEEIF